VVIHGFADVPRVISHQFAWRWAEDGRAWMQPLAWLLGRSLAAYAGIPRIENPAARLRAEQKVWMLSAKDDALIPPRANESLRAAFATSPAHFDYETEDGGHLRGEKDPRIPDLLRRTERWLVANGL
jgi:predicted esterase